MDDLLHALTGLAGSPGPRGARDHGAPPTAEAAAFLAAFVPVPLPNGAGTDIDTVIDASAMAPARGDRNGGAQPEPSTDRGPREIAGIDIQVPLAALPDRVIAAPRLAASPFAASRFGVESWAGLPAVPAPSGSALSHAVPGADPAAGQAGDAGGQPPSTARGVMLPATHRIPGTRELSSGPVPVALSGKVPGIDRARPSAADPRIAPAPGRSAVTATDAGAVARLATVAAPVGRPFMVAKPPPVAAPVSARPPASIRAIDGSPVTLPTPMAHLSPLAALPDVVALPNGGRATARDLPTQVNMGAPPGGSAMPFATPPPVAAATHGTVMPAQPGATHVATTPATNKPAMAAPVGAQPATPPDQAPAAAATVNRDPDRPSEPAPGVPVGKAVRPMTNVGQAAILSGLARHPAVNAMTSVPRQSDMVAMPGAPVVPVASGQPPAVPDDLRVVEPYVSTPFSGAGPATQGHDLTGPADPPVPRHRDGQVSGGPTVRPAPMPAAAPDVQRLADPAPLDAAAEDSRRSPSDTFGLASGPGPTAPVATSDRAAPALPASAVARQILQALAGSACDPGAPLDLALDPPELGRVRLSLSELNGALTLGISVDRPETADLMRRHIALLSEEFARAGLDAPSVSISHGGADGRAAKRASPLGSPAETPGQLADIPPDPVARPNAVASSGGLDLRL